jgi:DNA helicase-2/ATP-dependent DNA helicase PcrA
MGVSGTDQSAFDIPGLTQQRSVPAEQAAATVESLTEGLTDPQHQAVVHRGSPLLVVAGAGSGKTRVLTRRIAHLLASGDARPHQILAITFTNKAAEEMRNRVAELTGPTAKRMLVATFHSACLRMLRANATRIGFDAGFTVYDALDAKRLVELVMADQGIDTKKVAPKAVASMISEAKARLQNPEVFASHGMGEKDPYRRQVAQVYRDYQSRLRAANAMDFDDLLMKTVEMFRDCPDILEAYQERFRHILVDEFQDTNAVQNQLVLMLGSAYGNVCVVGDSDQSIYKFRAADIANILEFEKTFPDATTIVLEQNFRSTQNILDAANAVISNNPGRPNKRLFTNDGSGPDIKLYRAGDEYEEASWVASEIKRLNAEEGIDFGDIAIIYRTNAQSRVIEEQLVRSGTRYKVIGGIRYYDRKEVKDILAYLRLMANPQDEVSARRIINVPKRGLGATSVAAIGNHASNRGVSFGEAIEDAENIPGLTPKARAAVTSLKDLLATLRAQMQPIDPTDPLGPDDVFGLGGTLGEDGTVAPAPESEGDEEWLSPGELVDLICDQTGYRAELEAEGTHESGSRLENLEQLVTVAASYESLEEFLSMVALVADSDQLDETATRVSLMTLHIAKGLEYPAVFLVGLEEGIFPHSRSLDSGDPTDIEEERRLAYVGITRARVHLALSHAWTRSQWGNTADALPSRFLIEVPEELVTNLGSERQSRRPTSYGYGSSSRPSEDAPWELPRRHRGEDEGGAVFGRGQSQAREAKTSTGAHLIGLEAGDLVEHERWGQGLVLSVKGTDDRATAEIRFASQGTKTLMLSMAPLKRA